jgi:uncharacterized protein (TIGR03083 family)
MTELRDVARRDREAAAVAESIGVYLEGLEPAAWSAPSDCAGWTITNLACHLILVEALLGGSINRGIGGDAGPPPNVPGGAAGWREHRAREIARLSALPPEELLAQFRAGIGEVRQAIGRVVAGEGAGQQGFHPSAGAQPLAWFAGQWLVEIAVHDWDLRAAACAANGMAADVAPVALASLGPEMRDRMARCYRPAEGTAQSGPVRIALESQQPIAWLARLGDGRLEVAEGDVGRADATIETDPGVFAIVMTGRRPAHFYRTAGRWRVTGKQELANHLAASFSGY